jgi:hypothetical protein
MLSSPRPHVKRLDQTHSRVVRPFPLDDIDPRARQRLRHCTHWDGFASRSHPVQFRSHRGRGILQIANQRPQHGSQLRRLRAATAVSPYDLEIRKPLVDVRDQFLETALHPIADYDTPAIA